MPEKGEGRPTIIDMINQNHRLLVFTSDSSMEANEGIANQWIYMLENEREYCMKALVLVYLVVCCSLM